VGTPNAADRRGGNWLVRALRSIGIGPRRIELRPGQVWRYATRPGEEQSRVQILKVDSDPVIGEIIHIAITKVRILPSENGLSVTTIGHVPISREALEGSGLSLESKSGEPPDIPEGYKVWRDAFHGGTAGVFSIPVAEIVEVMEITIRDGSPSAD